MGLIGGCNKIINFLLVIVLDGILYIHKNCRMRLKQFLEDNYLKPQLVTDKTGVSRVTVSLWLNGHSIPRSVYAKIIEDVTGGEVKIQDFFDHYQEVHGEAVGE